MADINLPQGSIGRKPNKRSKTDNFRLANELFGKDCQVDIIVPFHGQYAKVSRLIESVCFFTQSNRYDLCLVDDGSPNADYAASLLKAKFHIVRREDQGGFGAALMSGFQDTKSPWVCFMHSDCKIMEVNWLKAMGTTLQQLKGHGVKMISARSNNPGPDADPRMQVGQGVIAEDFVLGSDFFLPLYCVLMSRQLFENINGFVRPYPFVGYEDQEIAHRMQKFGFKQAVCGKSWVWHEGGGTINALMQDNPRIKKVVEESNREACISHIRGLAGMKVKKAPVKKPERQPTSAWTPPQGYFERPRFVEDEEDFQPRSISPAAQRENDPKEGFDPSKVRSVAELIQRFGDGS
jgi:hypothetical protein